jgi:hypothetical protein
LKPAVIRRHQAYLIFISYNPYFSDPDYSFILFGQNVLNTVPSQLYYTYNGMSISRIGYKAIYEDGIFNRLLILIKPGTAL